MRVQGPKANEPLTPYIGTPGDVAEVRKGGGMANPGPSAQEPLQRTMKNKQAPATTPVEGSGCENIKHHTEREEWSRQFMEKAE